MSTITDAVDAIETAIKANLGTNMDFSGTGKVLRGRYAAPPQVPFACISAPPFESEPGPPMRGYERTAVLDVSLWCACTDPTTDTRARQGLTLAEAAVDAIETARSTAGNALYGGKHRRFVVRAVVLDADADPVPSGLARAHLVIEFTFVKVP